MSENNVAQETQTPAPKKSFSEAVINFFYAITCANNLKVMVLRLISYVSLLVGVIITIVSAAVFGSALVFFDDLVRYALWGVSIFAITEIFNKR